MSGINLEQAVKALGIDVPVMSWRMVGGRMELHLYGGRVVFYPEGDCTDPHPEPLPVLKTSASAGEGTSAPKARRGRRSKAPHPSPLPGREREKDEP